VVRGEWWVVRENAEVNNDAREKNTIARTYNYFTSVIIMGSL
jgi:hypothetical protein